ncbi:CBS domain-containing protein [Anaerofustis stercorihominis]|uniref:CBS domain-containing protein n=1 Tax=Anaerofustis stercorihominis TaxID=214853 RepID=UPI0039923CDD
MNRTEEFLQLYKKLEQTAVMEYNFPKDGKSISRLINLKCYKHIRRELEYCKEIRNILQHNPKVNDEYAIEPSNAMIELLSNILKQIETPKKAIEFAVDYNDIIKAYIGDNVMDFMNKMDNKKISHIPIMNESGIVRGVFGENTVFQCVLDEGIYEINDKTRFFHIKRYLSLDNPILEKFLFIHKNTLMIEIEDMLYNAYKRNERIGAIFITENGKEIERLIGLITPYDVIGYK